ncbi:protein JTB [Hyperolius riggenbachi]|uniref:protein JTB n=1 Tax=Hyperolius riggenbachi TaxID=752182 RepID=UPI0035A2D041
MAGWLVKVSLLLVAQRWVESSMVQEEKSPDDSETGVTPCWKNEEYTVSADCNKCNMFESKTLSQCGDTGFIEKVSCTPSEKQEYKSCRSVAMEKQVFWEFVGVMMIAAVVMSLVVVFRQRMLDRRALEKVRKQIESI